MANPVEQSLLAAARERWLAALTEGSRETVLLVDRTGRVQYASVSHSLARLLGHPPHALAARINPDIVHPDDRPRVMEMFDRILREPGTLHSADYRARHRLGHYFAVQSTAVNRLDDELIGAIVVHTHPAPDPLVDEPTGNDATSLIVDRAVLLDRVGQAAERARAEVTFGFSVLIVELERLKMLIGSYGETAVDEVLAEIASRILGLLRPQDTLARLQPGEFAVLLDGIGDRAMAARVADRIQKTVGTQYRVQDHAISATAIVGIATSERTYEQAEQVLRDASLATSRARGRGRRRRAVFQTQMRVEDTRFMAMVSALHSAVQDDQLTIHYQPVVALGDGAITGFEALLRWNHPSLGLISPAQFIPVAEETGIIVQLGRWVCREACRQMSLWNRTFGTSLHVAVNLSAKQFQDEELVAEVASALDDAGLDPRLLHLELTESVVLENKEQAIRALEAFKKMGIRLSLDDFGTGYSSFSYLYQLPYDTLKIDRSFVAQLGADGGGSQEIVHAIIVLAHNLRMTVVAEGVEQSPQVDLLKGMWCEFAQGYHYTRPVPAPEAEQLIAAGAAYA